MPAATVPVAKPTKPSASKPAKPAGFTKPAGFSKPAAQDLDEEEKKPTHTAVWVIVGIAVAVILFGLYQQYKIDQTPARVTDPVLGWPSDGSASDDSDSTAADEEESSAPAAADEESEDDE